MTKKLNTKKATQGFSVIKANASKQAVTKLVSFYKANDAKQANTYAPGGVVYEVALGSVNLMDSMNVKTLTSYAKKVGGAIKHPEEGKVFDLSDEVNKEKGIDNGYVKIYPINGYGHTELLRNLINIV